MRLPMSNVSLPWLLQAVLCLVLAASLGVAAWVSRRQKRALRVELSQTNMIDGLTIKRPGDWTLRREEGGLLLEEMRKSSTAPRKLRIRYSRSSIFMSPADIIPGIVPPSMPGMDPPLMPGIEAFQVVSQPCICWTSGLCAFSIRTTSTYPGK